MRSKFFINMDLVQTKVDPVNHRQRQVRWGDLATIGAFGSAEVARPATFRGHSQYRVACVNWGSNYVIMRPHSDVYTLIEQADLFKRGSGLPGTYNTGPLHGSDSVAGGKSGGDTPRESQGSDSPHHTFLNRKLGLNTKRNGDYVSWLKKNRQYPYLEWFGPCSWDLSVITPFSKVSLLKLSDSTRIFWLKI